MIFIYILLFYKKMLISDNQLYKIIEKKGKFFNDILIENNCIFKKSESTNNLNKFKYFLNNIDNNIINKLKNILLKDYNINFMHYKNHTNNIKMSIYHMNGLYDYEDYVWTDEEIIKEFIILLFCTYYEYINYQQ